MRQKPGNNHWCTSFFAQQEHDLLFGCGSWASKRGYCFDPLEKSVEWIGYKQGNHGVNISWKWWKRDCSKGAIQKIWISGRRIDRRIWLPKSSICFAPINFNLTCLTILQNKVFLKNESVFAFCIKMVHLCHIKQ